MSNLSTSCKKPSVVCTCLRIPKKLALAAIVFYRRVVSPLKPPTCRFYPSCSAYARDAIVRHGLGRGLWLSAKRLARCHPWHPGGYDPVK